MMGHNSSFIIIISKEIMQAFKEAEIGSEGHFSALYNRMNVSPPPPCMCTIHPYPPNIKPLHATSSINPPPSLGLVP